MFILYRSAFASPWKPYRIRLLFTHRNGCGGAISVTEQSCTAPISKAESHTRLVFVALRKASGGSRGGALRAAPLLIFRPNWGPKGQKKIWDPLPYLRVWMTGPPLISRSGSGNESYPVREYEHRLNDWYPRKLAIFSPISVFHPATLWETMRLAGKKINSLFPLGPVIKLLRLSFSVLEMYVEA